jgi:hypothetical protein
MGPGCETARGFVLLWREKGEDADLEAGLDSFKAHLAACPECRRRYQPLLPLMERDASAGARPAPDEAFVEKVMSALPDRSRAVRDRQRRLALPAAAAAAAILVVGGLALSRARIFPLAGDTVAVHFTVDAPDASSVVLVGSFSDWSVDDRFRLRRAGAESWELSVRLKKNELYSYGFLIDGEKWVVDPRASETIDDGFGSANSLLRL